MALIVVTPWRRTLPTQLHPETDLYTLGHFYLDAIADAGGIGVIGPWVNAREAADLIMERVDGLLLSGGSDVDPAIYGHELQGSVGTNPEADASDILMLAAAMDAGKPILGICRGAQVANVALGGTLHQHIWDRWDNHPSKARTEDPGADADAYLANRHDVQLAADSRLAALFGKETISTNSLHHQSIDNAGDDLEIVGRALDGSVEAVEHRHARLMAVQWHPERLTGEGHNVLFEWLVNEAGQ